MRGFLIIEADGSQRSVEGSRYDVSGDGALEVWLDGVLERRWQAGDWISIDRIGTRLAEAWPPPNLDCVVGDVAVALGRLGHYVHELRSTESFTGPAMNDVDVFVAEVLRRIGLDPASSDNRRDLEVVRRVVESNFALDR